MLACTTALPAVERVDEAALAVLVADMTGPHDLRPSGVPDQHGWADGPRVNEALDPPSDWTHMTAWGQAYVPIAGNPAVNTRIALRSIGAWYFSRSQQRWVVAQPLSAIDGAAYREDFADDASIPADIRTVGDATPALRVTEVLLTTGYNYHCWPGGGTPRFAFPRADLDGWYIATEARLVRDRADLPDDRASARILLGVGADYWRNLTAQWASDWSNNADIAIGRLRLVGNAWGWHHMYVLRATVGDPAEFFRAHPVLTILVSVPDRQISLQVPRDGWIFEIHRPGQAPFASGFAFGQLAADSAHVLQPISAPAQ